MIRRLERFNPVQWPNGRFLKLTHLLLLFVLFSLAGCQVDSETETPPESDSIAVSTTSTAEPSAEPEREIREQPQTEEASTQEPSENVEMQNSGMGNANVLFVEAQLAEDGTWNFTVTVEHADTGWEDYADGWDVVLPDGTIAKPDPDSPFTRLLLHPHETEQPFTRSQRGIIIPPAIGVVTVRAHDLADGYGGQEVIVDLNVASGHDFKVDR